MEITIRREILKYLLRSLTCRHELAYGLGKDKNTIDLVIIYKDLKQGTSSYFMHALHKFCKVVNLHLSAIIHYHEITLDPSPIDILIMRLWRLPWIIINSAYELKGWYFNGASISEVRIKVI